MPGVAESLFSLELVVDKLYIPHVVCRFPAVAFRLLDFPTIVIEHVEKDLANTIKQKIARDPYFHMPDQFSDLKDKDGNFIVKKGKSCLFKIPIETLNAHLSNTPLYVMVIDTYPDTPKLIGSSTVPLNELMNKICGDIRKKGESMPSVQGDKGLFKLYSLMGKEIGYFVLGFRLLCLGPGLIPHLPEAAVMKRSLRQQSQEEKSRQVDEIVAAAHRSTEETQTAAEVLLGTQEMGSMTDAEKQDVLLQTVQTEEKAVHVVLSEFQPVSQKQVFTSATQTERLGKQQDKKQLHNLMLKNKDDEVCDLDSILTNIVCPPPLLYNSDLEPPVCLAKPHLTELYTSDEDEDTLQDDVIQEVQCQDGSPSSATVYPPQKYSESSQTQPTYHQHQTVSPVSKNHHSKQNIQEHFVTTTIRDKLKRPAALPQILNSNLYPILSALLSELTRMQYTDVPVNAVAAAIPHFPLGDQARKPVTKAVSQQQQIVKEVIPHQPSPKQAVRMIKESASVDNRDHEESFFDQFGQKHRKSHRSCAYPRPNVPRNKSWIRCVPQSGGIHRAKLSYGLTHTQKLRLARSNPAWLEDKEKEEARAKAKKPWSLQMNVSDTENLNVVNNADTLTEVQRLAAEELNRTEDNLLDSFLGLSTSDQKVSRGRKKMKPRHPGKIRVTRPDLKSPVKVKVQAPSPMLVRKQLGESRYTSAGQRIPAGKTQKISLPLGSQKMKTDSQLKEDEEDDVLSDLINSQSQQSIEVRVPSANTESDSDGTLELPDEDEQGEMLPEDFKKTHIIHKFAGFINGDESFPDSIKGRDNVSVNVSDYQPMESTRVSKNFHLEVEESRQFQSSDNYDTQQFHSTEEPELLGLMTDEEDRSDVIDSGRRTAQSLRASIGSLRFPVVNPLVSESSPVPATRRSTAKPDLGNAVADTPRTESTLTSHGADKLAVQGTDRDTPLTPSPGSSKRPTPRQRRPLKRESIHTDSVSSYIPSDLDNPVISLSSDGNYSDDFHLSRNGSGDSIPDISSSPENFRLIPSAKLGYTIS